MALNLDSSARMPSPGPASAHLQATSGRLRLAIVTNIPAPYRVPVFDLIGADPGLELLALYAAKTEPDREWNLPPLQHAHVFLKPGMTERNGRYIHHNPDVWSHLRKFKPQVVLTTGFNPTHLWAWAYTLGRQCRHVAMTDGTDVSEARLSALHRAVRHCVFGSSARFVAASVGGRRLFGRYGVAAERVHFSPLCANMSADWKGLATPANRSIDLLFSGRLVPGKNAEFALRVAHAAAMRLGQRLQMAVLGSGPCEGALKQLALQLNDHLDVQFAGHVRQDELPGWYQRARLFVFPSSGDTWGVVANEACLASVPVLVTPEAGVAGELIRHGVNGLVLPLQHAAWVDATTALLGDPARVAALGRAAEAAVRPYTFENAAWGIADAARAAWWGPLAPPARTQFNG